MNPNRPTDPYFIMEQTQLLSEINSALILGPGQQLDWLERMYQRLGQEAKDAGEQGLNARREFEHFLQGKSSLTYDQIHLLLRRAENNLPEEVDYYGRRTLILQKSEITDDLMHRMGNTLSLKEIEQTVKTHLRRTTAHDGECSLYDKLDYFNAFTYNNDINAPVTLRQWISSYAVTGSNEGHYIHVESKEWHDKSGNIKREELTGDRWFLGKTFAGFEVAYEIAAEIARYLGA